MQAVAFTGDGRTEIVELPRPALREAGDAVVLVTTAAIGPWDVARFLNGGAAGDGVVPGGEFAGIVVETGSGVGLVEIDDLVVNTVQHVAEGGRRQLFGSATLPGGHAEYVRVPNADTTLTKITVSGEERAVLAGGTAGLGVAAAAAAVATSPRGTYTVAGCDPIGMTALVALRNAVSGGGRRAGARIFAIEAHPARATLASSFAATVFESADGPGLHRSDVVVVGAVCDGPGFGAVVGSVKPGGHIIFAEPYSAGPVPGPGFALPPGVTVSSVEWPGVGGARRVVTDLQIRRLDLTPLVSHVVPLDAVQEGYEAAAGPAPGVQKVLLKT